jgi:hypothetical protein
MRRLLFFMMLVLLTPIVSAQDTIRVTISSPSTALQTGQYYDMGIRLDGANDLWLINVEIQYDPTALYIVGTQSGQPFTQTSLFDLGGSVVIRNEARDNFMRYTISMIAPSPSTSGSDNVATFRVYPLKGGETTLEFIVVEAVRVFIEGEGETRSMTGQTYLPVAPENITFTVTGDTVEIPPEATATPLPTPTDLPFVPGSQNNEPTARPTFVTDLQVTADAPQLVEAPAEGGSNINPILLGLVLVAFAGIGLGVLWFVSQRGKKKR